MRQKICSAFIVACVFLVGTWFGTTLVNCVPRRYRAIHRRETKHMNKDFGSSHSAAREKTHLAWFRDDTIDNWRHRRMYEPVIDALRSTKNDEWVTVGDGRYGLDAIRMQRAGFTNVLPTDISSNMLAESKRRGLIRRYSVENGEALSFGDGRFDYVLCKEALHHSPRPPAMIYELLRVARKGVVLIEPQDHKDRGDKYEEAGNYVYSLSRREMSKLARAANLAAVATKGQNDAFEAGLEFERATNGSAVFARIKQMVAQKDKATGGDPNQYTKLLVVLFVEPPSQRILADFERLGGWTVERYRW